MTKPWHLLPALIGLALLGALPAREARAQAPTVCNVPPEFRDYGGDLPYAGKAIAGRELKVLILGSASGQGKSGNSNTEAAWPYRFAAHLEQRVPGLKIEVKMHAERGSTANDQYVIMRKVLAQGPVDLVIWQTGTVEAVRGSDPQEMAEALENGISAARNAHADLVLMDQQFSRFIRANTQIDAYRDTMRLIATGNAVPVLRRYDLMQLWADRDGIDLERTVRGQLERTVDKVHDCLGRALSGLVLRASGVVGPKP